MEIFFFCESCASETQIHFQNYKGEVGTFSRSQLQTKQPTKYSKYSLLGLVLVEREKLKLFLLK